MLNIVFDVDGVLTTGQFFYNSEGKVFKVFGADDNDALSILNRYCSSITFVTGDKRGFDISHKRITVDMGWPLHLVSTIDRASWIKGQFDLSKTVYMGDGIFDFLVMREVKYGIAPANAHSFSLAAADYVTTKRGGEGAVAEACVHILEKFYNLSIPTIDLKGIGRVGGDWPI